MPYQVIVLRKHDTGVTQQATWGATFIAYSLAIKNDLICVVDPLRSASLIRYEDDLSRIVDVGKEFSAYGLFAAAFLRDDEESMDASTSNSIIAADLDLNLFTAKSIKISANGDRDQARQETYTLKVQAMIHSGDVINKFAPGE